MAIIIGDMQSVGLSGWFISPIGDLQSIGIGGWFVISSLDIDVIDSVNLNENVFLNLSSSQIAIYDSIVVKEYNKASCQLGNIDIVDSITIDEDIRINASQGETFTAFSVGKPGVVVSGAKPEVAFVGV